MSNAASSFLTSGGIASFKFDKIGAEVSGRILSLDLQQQKDFESGELLFWKDGAPRQQVRIVIETQERDPDIFDDDGSRAIYAKGGLQAAVRDAVRKSGAKTIEVGGHLTVSYVDDGEAPRRGLNAAKIYRATYVAGPPEPPEAKASDFLNDEDY
jgi:hypothetical protein